MTKRDETQWARSRNPPANTTTFRRTNRAVVNVMTAKIDSSNVAMAATTLLQLSRVDAQAYLQSLDNSDAEVAAAEPNDQSEVYQQTSPAAMAAYEKSPLFSSDHGSTFSKDG